MLLAGTAQVDITPKSDLFLTGYIAREGPMVGIHDPLYATALVLSSRSAADESRRTALLSCDLLALDEPTVADLRQRIQAATGIPAADIMVACTHTHSGPATVFLQDCGEVSQDYLEQLKRKLVALVGQAGTQMLPVTVASGKGEWAEGVIDRRDPGAPVDPEIGVICLHKEDGDLAALLVNYACHPVVLGGENRLVSGDYPGALKAILQQRLGVPVIFLTGAAGNINPAQCGDFRHVQSFAEVLAEQVMQVLPGVEISSPARLHVRSRTLSLPLDPPPPVGRLEELVTLHRQGFERSLSLGQTTQSRMEQAMLNWAKTTLERVLQGQVLGRVPLEIQVIHLGGACICAISGEVFSDLGKIIKNYHRDGLVCLSGFTNGDIGYIAPRPAYAQGGYEILEAYRYYGFPGALHVGAGEEVAVAALKLIQETYSELKESFDE